MKAKIPCNKTMLLIAATAGLLTACAGSSDVSPVDEEKQAFDDFRNEVRVVIADPARQTEVIALIDTLAENLHTVQEGILDRNRRARQLNANYDASRADFEALFEEATGEIIATQKIATESHRALLTITTSEEWSALSKTRSRAIDAAIKSAEAT